MKVLHLRNSDVHGGPEKLIVTQVRFASPDVEHHVASFTRFADEGTASPPLGGLLEAVAREGAEVHAIPQRSSYDRRIVPAFAALVEGLQPDLVLGHDYKADLVAARALRGQPTPRVAMVHGFTRENLKVRFLEWMGRRALRRAAAVIAVSAGVREELVRAKVPSARITVIPNGIDVERVAVAASAGREDVRRALGVDDGTTLLLFLGRLSPEKGPDVLLEAFGALVEAHPDLRLVYVGDGLLRDELEARAKRLPAGRVRFTGWRQDAAAYLGAADVYVQPSHREGLPLALLEAMASRTSIVATDVGGVSEALDGGRAGLVVPPGDPLGLTAAIETVLADPAGRAARIEAAAERVAARHSAREQAARIEALLRSVATA